MLKRFRKEKHEPFTVVTVVMLLVLLVYLVSLFLPLIWAFITSFKDQPDFRTNINGLPRQWVWNYTYIYKMFFVRVETANGTDRVYMWQMYINSFEYAVGCAFCQTFVTCIVAYACARFPFKFSNVVYTTVIVVMILPIVGSLPSELAVVSALGLYDNMIGMWIMKCHFLGIYFLVFYNTFKAMPMGYSEAAKVDGAGNLRIMLQIVLPLVKNLFFTVVLINFIGYWNDYQSPLIYMPTHPTLAYGMYSMAISYDNAIATIPLRMASSMLVFIPILILFMIFQKRLLGNLTMGGLKE